MNSISNKFAQIASIGETLFTTKDLGNLWQIRNTNTLYTTLKRYTQTGLIFRVYKWLYSLKPVEKIDPFLLGLKALHSYSYISTETVLMQEGIIAQHIPAITLVSAHSKLFTIGASHYRSRQLDPKFLFQEIGIDTREGLRIATTERAVADLLYFAPHYYFDNPRAINWKKVKKIQQTMGYPLTPTHYDIA